MKTSLKISLITFSIALLWINHSNAQQFSISEGLYDAQLKATIENNVSAMLVAFNQAAESQKSKVKINKNLFTQQAFEDINAMWKVSPMSCPAEAISTRCLHSSSGYQVRGIPIDFLNANEEQTRQELTINFTSTGIISSVNIAMEMHRYDAIISEQQSAVDYAHRQKVIDFIENMRTAYNRRDIDYISKIYSEDALIITGRVITAKKTSFDGKLYTTNNKVVYTTQNKDEYIAKLKNIFKRNLYVNINFENIKVERSQKYADIYGVTLKQYWETKPNKKSSKGYKDVGYLLLIIDFTNSEDPQIQVRTWQPAPYDNNPGIAESEAYRLGMFNLSEHIRIK